ncbi:MAG: hypothetical protein B7Y45_04305 [Sphingomonas sp. 28-66-16]|nr:MAG: hypothetical protein B7Y45_04305 [Sphingomonas sp. 28-66-16]
MRTRLSLLAIATCLVGTAHASTPVRVTRFHLDAPIERTTIAVEPITGSDPASLEARGYADSVAAELTRQGFRVTPPATPATLRATVSFSRELRTLEPARPPVTIGLGAGGFGGGFGGGGSVAFGVGKGRARESYASQLSVQLRRSDGGAVVWEGRAQMEADSRARDAQPGVAADKLAAALFKGFPGESGRTITVK